MSLLAICYSNHPKIPYTNISDKMAYVNSADPDQTDPECTVCHSTKYFVTQPHKTQNIGKNSMK